MRSAVAAARRRRAGRARQRLLPFRERQRRLERSFRLAIVAATALALATIWAAFPSGRSAVAERLRRARWAAWRTAGLEPPRAEVDAAWRDHRGRGESATRDRYRALFRRLSDDQRAFLCLAGLGPDEAVVRWGNYDMSLLMSSEVFERDDDGRYYRLRPDRRSVWLRQERVPGLDVCQWLVPETPEVLRAAERADARIVPGTSHTTNSWGCRGPEPDLDAPVRGLVLGDSYMQGYFVGDDQTPPECLRRDLEGALGARVALLNAGHLGYSPEHYYHTLVALGDRFRPRFVVVGLYANDFGEESEVLRGEGDWAEEGYWLDRIMQYCRSRGALCLIAPVPCQSQIVGVRVAGNYPGHVADLLRVSGGLFCDATEAFVDAELELRRDAARAGRPHGRSPLYNGHLGDGHLSPRGAELWGRVVARRLALLLDTGRP